MPSPFPGMDPYLEDPALWPDVHSRLINASSELLAGQLRPKYFVQIDERLYVANDYDPARDVIVPDLRIRETAFVASQPKVSTGGGGTAVATPAVDPGIELPWTVDVREGRLEILDREAQRIITVVEFLSHANKVNGSAGKKAYEEKRREVLDSQANLVEVDLLRTGSPIVGPSGLPPHAYVAQVWRWDPNRGRLRRLVWPMALRERLKVIPVPVRPEDPDAVLDLQAALNMAYDRAGYDLRVKYDQPPAIAFAREDEKAWVGEVVAKRG